MQSAPAQSHNLQVLLADCAESCTTAGPGSRMRWALQAKTTPRRWRALRSVSVDAGEQSLPEGFAADAPRRVSAPVAELDTLAAEQFDGIAVSDGSLHRKPSDKRPSTVNTRYAVTHFGQGGM